jgi:hypothetical protein
MRWDGGALVDTLTQDHPRDARRRRLAEPGAEFGTETAGEFAAVEGQLDGTAL